mmetsp:Transcript_40055/g.114103  ORF Transcript_40055/g.114103 Transcript_40055/m.114103 type:complete len:238 (-) Transcript_40055:1107-1820(-)
MRVLATWRLGISCDFLQPHVYIFVHSDGAVDVATQLPLQADECLEDALQGWSEGHMGLQAPEAEVPDLLGSRHRPNSAPPPRVVVSPLLERGLPTDEAAWLTVATDEVLQLLRPVERCKCLISEACGLVAAAHQLVVWPPHRLRSARRSRALSAVSPKSKRVFLPPTCRRLCCPLSWPAVGWTCTPGLCRQLSNVQKYVRRRFSPIAICPTAGVLSVTREQRLRIGPLHDPATTASA